MPWLHRWSAAGREAAAQLAGEDFLVGLDRQRDDIAGQRLVPVARARRRRPGWRDGADGQWRAVEAGVVDVHAATLAALPAQRAAVLCETVTIDLDTTDVEIYGRQKAGMAYNYHGQRCGRRTWRAGPKRRRCWPRT